jgi:hypothetical protein
MTIALPTPVAEAFDATNTADLDRFVAAFALDGLVDDAGRTFRGHQQIRQWSMAESIGLQQTFTLTGSRVVDGRTVARATIGGGGYNGPATFTITLSPDEATIQSMVITA